MGNPQVPIMKLQKIWVLLLVLMQVIGSQSLKDAYVTLLYGEDYVLGVRVLGKSLRDTGTAKDMVVLATDGVSDYSKTLLEADGWIVEKVSLSANPNPVHAKRMWGIYTKLKIFNMTNYKKVVYLDADTLVVKNIEDIFKCGKFCAILEHSERLNTGVLVVEPSQALFNDMMSKVTTLPSYSKDDQGFIDSYYSDFPNAHIFNPNLPLEVLNSKPTPKMERLSTLYNAEVSFYLISNKWKVNEDEIRILHYTLGPFKPWEWWASWIIKPVDVWQSVREQLGESLPGTGGGRNPNDELYVKILFLIPFCALLLFYFYPCFKTRDCSGSIFRISLWNQIKHLYYDLIPSKSALPYSSVNSVNKFSASSQAKTPAYLGGLSVFVCFAAALVSFGISLSIVPRQVMPWTGLLLMYEWTFAIFFMLFGGFLHLIYLWGKRTAGSFSSGMQNFSSDSGKGHQRPALSCGIATWYYWLGMALLAVAVPTFPCIFGINALFPRIRSMVVGGILLASFMTYASDHLAIRSFLKGLDDMTGTTVSYDE